MTNTQHIQLALIGCGGMGLRQLHGLIELKRCGFDTFHLVAVCDIKLDHATHVAGVAEAELGLKPRIYTPIGL